MKRLLAGCALGVASLVLAVAPALAASDVEVCLFEDAAESRGSLPLNVESVTVERSAGAVAFDVFFAAPFSSGLPEGAGIQVAIDSDRDRTTGDHDGDDYRLVAVRHEGAVNVALGVWDTQAGEWTETPASGLSFAVIETSENGARFEVDEAELGRPGVFAFWVLAGTEWTSGDPVADLAPSDGKTSGAWVFPTCDYRADDPTRGAAASSGVFGDNSALPMLPILIGVLAAIMLLHGVIEAASGKHPSPAKLKSVPPTAVVAVTPLAVFLPCFFLGILVTLAVPATPLGDSAVAILFWAPIGIVVASSGLTSGRWWISTIPLGMGVALIPALLLASLMEEGRLPTANDLGLYSNVFVGWAILVAVGSLTRWTWTATHPHTTTPPTPSNIQPSH